MAIPHHVRSLEDYWVWAEQLINGVGAWPEDDLLRVRPIEDPIDPAEWVGLIIQNQMIHYADGTSLKVSEVLDEDLVVTRYAFHYQTSTGKLIWRKDNYPGHFGRKRDREPVPHIHDNPGNPKRVRRYESHDLEEALRQVEETAGRG